ncbi:uncharacterized protein LOC117327523 isoform X1 [Pecten maximus]|uniref:uncharacterized protein LOC117327523 isoform X1 n=1 Tax=Pecten maximus TaxID=6579 RepID=UPI001458D028|nr:uncharacterized protein LOC117327523 isoform X1 [Pecten maximus]
MNRRRFNIQNLLLGHISKLDQKLTSERSIVTRAQEKHDGRPVNVKKQVKSDSKCVGTVKRPRKDASPEDKSRPPTREEIYENINKMAAAQILSKSDSVKTKKTAHCPEDKSQNQKIGTKKRGRPRIVKESDDETNSALESPSKRTKTKSRLCKSVSPSVSLHSPSPPLLSPQPTTSPSRFRLSMGNIQTLSDDIKCVLNNKIQQSSEVVEKYIGVEVKNINTGEEWSQHTPGPETLQGPQTPDPIQRQPIRSNFGPVPMCLYKVQTDTDETPMDNSLELVTPKIEIDIAEDESCGQCFVKVEPGLSTECSVTASGITQNSTPIIKTICTGPVCGGDNCMHEHSVIVEDCDNADTDCVQESFNQDAKEAEPVIIIDD